MAMEASNCDLGIASEGSLSASFHSLQVEDEFNFN
jgi:hypothetical protein